MAEQLWDNERIAEEMRRIGGGTRLYIDDAATVGKQIRDDLLAALDAANETVAELQDALDGMRGIAQQRMDRVRELEAATDLEALSVAYNKGRVDGWEDCRKRIAELEASFDLRWDSDMRAIKQWQAATGEELKWPNHADLCVWLMQRIAELEAQAAREPIPQSLEYDLITYAIKHGELPQGYDIVRRKEGR